MWCKEAVNITRGQIVYCLRLYDLNALVVLALLILFIFILLVFIMPEPIKKDKRKRRCFGTKEVNTSGICACCPFFKECMKFEPKKPKLKKKQIKNY